MISVIFPYYNEHENLEELIRQCTRVLAQAHRYDFELIFVDDGSLDESARQLRQCYDQDKRIRVIRLSRNFGSHAAISAGLHYCSGDCAIVLAADLQDPPDLIPRLIQEWERGLKIVWAVRAKREGLGFFRKAAARFYYALVNALSSIRLPPSGADAFLIDRKAIEGFKNMPEIHNSIFMAITWLGFAQGQILYTKQARFMGQSKWKLRRVFKMVVDSIFAFSDFPLKCFSFIGTCLFVLGCFLFVRFLWHYGWGAPGACPLKEVSCFMTLCENLKCAIKTSGWQMMFSVLFILSGLQMMMFGVLGEYLLRTYDESRRRPRYIVEYTLD